MFYNWAKTVEPLVPPRRAKQRNVRSHALRDELPSKLIRDRNPSARRAPCTLPPLTPDFQLRPHPSYTVLSPPQANNHQANGINSPPSLFLDLSQILKRKKISRICRQTSVDGMLTGRSLIGTLILIGPSVIFPGNISSWMIFNMDF